MSGTLDDQYRIEQVQVLNWGGYSGLQVMKAGRASTAILGPSGRGKSTLLDAMASVIMPNPQAFNQAARDDRGNRHERTVYSYARGQTVNQRDANRRSSTTAYLRPPGTPGFVSGAAITWANGHGHQVTAFRLAWVGPDVTGNESVTTATIYGFVHDAWDLTTLHGLKPVRAGGPPLSKASLERYIDLGRGDVVDERQSRMHARMRRVMSMGATEESQRLAMHLLRRAQASKGIFSINDLFKDFVLTVPQALERWQVTLAHYEEASRLYGEFELARRKMEALRDLVDVADRYQAAFHDHYAKRVLLEVPDEPATQRLRVWHAGGTLAWAARQVEDNRLAKAEKQELLQAARTRCAETKERYDLVLQALTAAGGDRTSVLRAQLTHAEEDLRRVDRRRGELTVRLAVFGQVLPESSGDLVLLQECIAADLENMKAKGHGLTERYRELAGQLYQVAGQLGGLQRETSQLKQHQSNVPPQAVQRRDQIAHGAGVPAERLKYAGELLEISPEHRGWEKAIVTVLLPLARDLVVDEGDFPRVRAYVNDHHMHGAITLARARSGLPLVSPILGTVPAMLDITEGPNAGWLSERLTSRFSYLCVERDTDLDTRVPEGATGAVTRSGMRTTSRDRVTKDDSEIRYRWIGRDTQRLRRELEEEGRKLADEHSRLHEQVEAAQKAADGHVLQTDKLRQLGTEIIWEEIDREPHVRRIATLNGEIAGVDTPENRKRREDLETAQEKKRAADNAREALTQEVKEIDTAWASLCDLEDDMNRLLEANAPLTDDELALTASLPFQAPSEPATIDVSYSDAVRILRAQIDQHARDRDTLEGTLLATFRAYRNIDERTAREIDETIDSLSALLAIREQLAADDLPRARERWLKKVDDDLNQALRTVLTQIDADSREIRRGLAPINRVLSDVPFRQGSALTLDTVEQPNSDLREFRDIVTTYSRDTPLGVDLFNDDETVEASFRRLRGGLARLSERSRTGDTWRKRVFDAREHVQFRAIETRPDGTEIIHDGVSGMSGGEGQELIAFILGAALRYRLGEGGESLPVYGSVILDEGFVKADSDFTGRALGALQALGFQLIIGAPREKATAFEDFVDLVAYVNTDPASLDGVRIYSMTIEEALQLAEDAS